jgi:hypothetical protein
VTSPVGPRIDGQAPESVVLLLQGAAPSAHPGIVDGYERLRASGVVRSVSVHPVFGPSGVQRGDAFWTDVFAAAYDSCATLVVLQYYHSPQLPDPRPMLERLRRLPSRPSIVSTLGDPFMNGYFGLPKVPRSFLQAASASDLVTLTSMGALADYVARFTEAPTMLLPHGACQVRFGQAPDPVEPEEVEFDAVFVGSRNRARNPALGFYWHGRRRERLVGELAQRFGSRFAVFGSGWDSLPGAQGPVPFGAQVDAVRRARVVVGGVPFSRSRYYTSNRPFIQATSGVPVLDVAVPGVELMLRDREHWVLAEEAELLRTLDELLAWPATERTALGQRAASHVLRRQTQAHRVAALVENVRRLRAAKGKRARPTPYLPFFLDGTDVRRESRLATRNWGAMG